MEVIRFTAERAVKLDGEQGDIDIEEALVSAVRRFARPEGRWAEFEIPTVEGLGGTSEDVMGVIFTVGIGVEDFEWSAFADRGFGDAAVGRGTVDFNGGEDKVSRFVENKVAG